MIIHIINSFFFLNIFFYFAIAFAMDKPSNSSPYPVGYRFDPDDEVLMYYVRKKIFNESVPDIIPSAKVYDANPEDLPFDRYKYGDGKTWYFYTIKPNQHGRAGNGYWSLPTEEIAVRGNVPGFRKELVYCDSRGQKTNWFMHEYSVHPNVIAHVALEKNDRREVLNIVICKIFRKDASRRSSNAGSSSSKGGSSKTGSSKGGSSRRGI